MPRRRHSPFRSPSTRALTKARAVAIVGALTVGALGAQPAPATAKQQKRLVEERLKVVSVDGPLDFTVRERGRNAKVRLADMDAPLGARPGRPAECGADAATAALKTLLRRGTKLHVAGGGRFEDGRELVRANFRGAGTVPSLDARLFAAGGARPGLPRDIADDTYAPTNELDLNYLVDIYSESGADPTVDAARAGRGVWGACGRRFHAPGGEPAPASTPAPWTVDPDGTTRAIGALTLPSELRPSTVLRFRDVAAVLPDLEIVRNGYDTCVGFSGATATRFNGLEDDEVASSGDERPCGEQVVLAITSLGPSALTVGPKVSDAPSVLPGPFPSAKTDETKPADVRSGYIAFDGGTTALPWAWRTGATVAGRKITGFFTRLSVNYA